MTDALTKIRTLMHFVRWKKRSPMTLVCTYFPCCCDSLVSSRIIAIAHEIVIRKSSSPITVQNLEWIYVVFFQVSSHYRTIAVVDDKPTPHPPTLFYL